MSSPSPARTAWDTWLVWAALVAVSLTSVATALTPLGSAAALTVLMALASAKALLVLTVYMEALRCPRSVTLALLSWPAVALGVVVGLHLTLGR